MSNETHITIQKIIQALPGAQQSCLITPIQIGETNLANELVLFAKPELLEPEDPDKIANSLALIFQKMDEFGAKPAGVMLIGGALLAEKEIMAAHYGFINTLSRFASQRLTEADFDRMANILEIPSLAGFQVFGGHEYLQHFPGETTLELDDLWFSKKALKIRSGFYIQAYEKFGQKLVLVNGFHPSQLHHFTNPAHRIVLMLVHADASWTALKNQMVGATFPEKAEAGSIRGQLYADPQRYGQPVVNINRNGVHLSAGPFEAMFEITNFFGKILNTQPSQTPPLALKQMRAAGLSDADALRALEKPLVHLNGKDTDLFTATEDTDSAPAIALWKKNL